MNPNMIAQRDQIKGATHLLLQGLLALKEDHWLEADGIRKLASSLAVEDLDDQIYFYRDLLEIARAIPQKIFASPSERVKFIEMIQGVLDECIEREDDQV